MHDVMRLIRTRSPVTRTRRWPALVVLTLGGAFFAVAIGLFPVAMHWGLWTTEWAGQSVVSYAKNQSNIEDVTVSVRPIVEGGAWGSGGPQYDAGAYRATIRLRFSGETDREAVDEVVSNVTAYAESLRNRNEWSILN
jgi:hypothetical protein